MTVAGDERRRAVLGALRRLRTQSPVTPAPSDAAAAGGRAPPNAPDVEVTRQPNAQSGGSDLQVTSEPDPNVTDEQRRRRAQAY